MSILFFITRLLVSIPTFFITLLILHNLDYPIFKSTGIALLTSVALYQMIKWITRRRFLKENNITRQEYAYIKRNLKEAKEKLKRLNKVFIKIRNIQTFKQMIEIHRLVKRIFSIVKREPRRFYQAENFFFRHLDSVVEIAEKYAFLSQQPVKNEQLYHSLSESSITLDELTKSLEKDLYVVLQSDIEHLSIELDVAKHSLKKLEHPLDDERRNINE
ncbi:5-bromo-4-chloroindolyl phosphate hydrolysis protein [Oikeobacillus pervagus]|uniref:5-bromo-4-chloroindolyl phosphate hydrolysis protein n=1 Tax=Oikeobacillus pervagus TaxID=1325931 RepID=A0AAJ1SZ20_9BACI|nr:5-bromo-4-chloroindolyl phosphate hydrolysis family protein [Oikeobacillus pervagus]MDQ0214332.1 5-bromo-4-chloroindolyl phosphate hydrolysis protein [Oikeobacillus pervagus]